MQQRDAKKDLHRNVYERVKFCPECRSPMQYMYGEEFECPQCKRRELSDFGKVKEFLDTHGPQPAVVINQNTGVELDYINMLLRQGRIEVPDGSEVYIKCQKCGTDIRYGRYCPECMVKVSKELNGIMWSTDMGEKPKVKKQEGTMHYMDKMRKNK
jgi:hypothetical protein